MTCPHIVWALREGKARNLTAHERLILMILAERANGDDLSCWPSIDLLGEDAGISRRSVQYALRGLAKHDLIAIKERHLDTSIYYVNRPKDVDAHSAPRRANTAPRRRASRASPPPIPPASNAPEGVQKMQKEGANDAHKSPIESLKGESPNTEIHNDRGVVVGSSTARAGACARTRRRLPEGWYPSEAGVAYAKERNVDRDELEHFRDHHTARGNTMLDWDAAWRTWCRNAKRYAARDPAKRLSVHEQVRQEMNLGSFLIPGMEPTP